MKLNNLLFPRKKKLGQLQSNMRRRYFGTSGMSFEGGVFSPNAPNHCFEIELLDGNGHSVASVKANQNSLKEDIPDGHGFSIPIPSAWLTGREDEMLFQFRIVETGDLFPKKQRVLPLDKLLKRFHRAVESGATLGRQLRKFTRDLPSRLEKDAIVVATHSMNRTGAPLIILELVRHLRKQYKRQIVLLCLEPRSALCPEFEQQCVEVVDDLKRCFKVAREETIEFLFSLQQSLSQPVALVNSLCSTEIASACREVGFDVRSLLHEYPYAFEAEQVRKHIQASSGVVFPCKDVYERFQTEGLLKKSAGEDTQFYILPQGCYQLDREDIDEIELETFSESFRQENRLRSSDRLVVACGTIDSRKGFDWFASLIQHFCQNSQYAFTTHFLWIGPTADESVYFHAIHDMTRTGVIGHFHHAGDLKDVRLAMRQADLFLLCSRIDPFPSVVLEALVEGLPVIAFDRDQGSAELIKETGFGKVVPYQDLEATTAAIDYYVQKESPEISLGTAGAEFVAEHFQFSDYANRLFAWIFDGQALPSVDQEKDPMVPLIPPPGEKNLLSVPPSGCPVDHTIIDESGALEVQARDGTRLENAMDRALNFVSDAQHIDGEISTLLWFGDDPQTGVFDSSPFFTTLAAFSLEHCLPRAQPMLNRALSFLQDHMEPNGVWRYNSRKHFKHIRVPPDVDSTSCASFILKRNGIEVPDNHWIFKENQSADGLHYTWMLPEQSESPAFRAYLSALDALAKIRTPEKPRELEGNPRFAGHKDWVPENEIDATVNVNVALYLGSSALSEQTIDYLFDVVEKNLEGTSTFYYCDVMSFYYMMARACDHGVPRFKDLASTITERIEERLANPQADQSPLNIAMASCALLTFSPESEAIATSINILLETQQKDGSWPRDPFYTGPESAYWGSDELTTCLALEALARYAPKLEDPLEQGRSLGIEPDPDKGSIFLDMQSESFLLNPYPAMAFLRKHYPVVYNKASGTWLVSQYKDAVQVLEHQDVYSSHGNSFEAVLMGADGPRQEQVHNLVKSMFSADHIEQLELKIRKWVTPFLQSFQERGVCEFYKELAAMLPIQVTTYILGAPQSMTLDFKRWGNVLKRISSNSKNSEIAAEDHHCIEECRNYFNQHIADEKKNPSGTPYSVLINPEEPSELLDDNELVDISVLLMSAGAVTTINLLATAIYYLAKDPELWKSLRDNQENIPIFVEEVLRFETPGQEIMRISRKKSILGGNLIPARQPVQIMTGSANRDETIFPQADHFLPGRKPNRHIAFGRGAHACVGMAVSRLETNIVIEMMLEAFAGIEIDTSANPAPIRNDHVLRCPVRVPLRLINH